MKKFFLTFLAVLSFGRMAFAQEDSSEKFHPHHTIGVLIGHTNISKGVGSDGDNKWLSLPSWAINYNYKFSPHWAIGLHNDIITENFEVEEHLNGSNNSTVERSFPIASVLMTSYKPGKHFSYLIGAGGEFSHTGNLFLIRIGVEYGCHISKKWEFNANISNDLKINAYNSWAIGMGVTRILNTH